MGGIIGGEHRCDKKPILNRVKTCANFSIFILMRPFLSQSVNLRYEMYIQSVPEKIWL